jgi:hypothetical protein
MDYDAQRKLALRLFGDLGEGVRKAIAEDCFEEILDALEPHRDEVLKRIEHETIPSRWALVWAIRFGDLEVMRDRVTESADALDWARLFGDLDVMRDRVNESAHALNWAYQFGDLDAMRDRVTESAHALAWAVWFGDLDVMRDRVIGCFLVAEWNREFPNDQIVLAQERR